ncbi:MAG TPA: tetratricopeptide repeat protein, partial [Candidatus Edwardsbacteria bacterium]|nr:tetratricopeptide repeat protein [Candidatus Edwardsbacteria bacterium]
LEGPVLLGLAAAAGLAAIALWCARRRPAIAFGIGWFFVTMAVESSVIPIRDVIFEHRLYLPMAGCAIAAADATGWLLQGMRRRLLVTVMAVTVLGLGLSTYARNEIWRDPLRLWNDAVAKSPLKFRPYIYRGTAYNQVGTYRRAIADFDRALELQPGLTKALYDKGNSYLSLGLPDSAIRCYGQALAVDSGYADAWVNSGIAWSRRGDTSRAAACFSRAVQIDTADIQARYYRALAEIALRQDSLAVADLRTVLAADPTYVTAYKALGRALLQRGDPAAAEIAFLRYIEHQPDDPEGYQLQTHARRARRTNTPGRMGPGNAPHNKVP